MQKTVGILGGMGPEAGAAFYRSLIRLTPARRDQDHLQAILYSQTKIPDRGAHLLSGGDSPLPALKEAVAKLESWGADLIAVPCNTAHYFHGEMQAAVSVPVLNILEITAAGAARLLAPGAKAGLLATGATAAAGLYEQPLRKRGLSLITPRAPLQRQVQRCIVEIKSGPNALDKASRRLEEALAELSRQGAGAAIFGCTELGLIHSRVQAPFPILDSLELLAQATVESALGRQPLESETAKAGASRQAAQRAGPRGL